MSKSVNVLNQFAELIRTPLYVNPGSDHIDAGSLDDCFYGNPLAFLLRERLAISGTRHGWELWDELASYGVGGAAFPAAYGREQPRNFTPYPVWVNNRLKGGGRSETPFDASALHDEKDNRARVLLLFEVLRAMKDWQKPNACRRLVAIGWSCHGVAASDGTRPSNQEEATRLWEQRNKLYPSERFVGTTWEGLDLLAAALLALEGKTWADVPADCYPAFQIGEAARAQLVQPFARLHDDADAALAVQWNGYVKRRREYLEELGLDKTLVTTLRFPGERGEVPEDDSLQAWLNSLLTLKKAQAERLPLDAWIRDEGLVDEPEIERQRKARGRMRATTHLGHSVGQFYRARKGSHIDPGSDAQRKRVLPLALYCRAVGAFYYLERVFEGSNLQKLVRARRIEKPARSWLSLEPELVRFASGPLERFSFHQHTQSTHEAANLAQPYQRPDPRTLLASAQPTDSGLNMNATSDQLELHPIEREAIRRRSMLSGTRAKKQNRFAPPETTSALRHALIGQLGVHLDSSRGLLSLYVRDQDAPSVSRELMQTLLSGDFFCLLRLVKADGSFEDSPYISCDPQRTRKRQISDFECTEIPLHCWHQEQSILPQVLQGKFGSGLGKEVCAYEVSVGVAEHLDLVVFIEIRLPE